MGRPSNTQARQAQIVEAAVEVFATRGYEAATVADVALSAGLATGLVHYHFASKLEILLRVAARLAQEIEGRLEKRLSRAGTDPFARLDAFVDTHLAQGAEASATLAACWTVVAAEAVRQAPVREAYGRVVARELETLEALLRACAEARGASSRGARAGAAALFATIQGYFVLASAARPLVPRGSAAKVTRRLARALVGEAS